MRTIRADTAYCTLEMGGKDIVTLLVTVSVTFSRVSKEHDFDCLTHFSLPPPVPQRQFTALRPRVVAATTSEGTRKQMPIWRVRVWCAAAVALTTPGRSRYNFRRYAQTNAHMACSRVVCGRLRPYDPGS